MPRDKCTASQDILLEVNWLIIGRSRMSATCAARRSFSPSTWVGTCGRIRGRGRSLERHAARVGNLWLVNEYPGEVVGLARGKHLSSGNMRGIWFVFFNLNREGATFYLVSREGVQGYRFFVSEVLRHVGLPRS